MFSLGKFSKGGYEELYKEYLHCPKSWHKELTQDLQLEMALCGLDQQDCFNPIGEFRDKLLEIPKSMMIAQRP